MAGLDGIQNRIDPGEPLDKDIYDLSPEQLKNVPSLPGSLDEALNALEADHDYLLKGDVFTPQLIDRWITYKREKEIQPLQDAPAPAGVRHVLRHLRQEGRKGEKVKRRKGKKACLLATAASALPSPFSPLPLFPFSPRFRFMGG